MVDEALQVSNAVDYGRRWRPPPTSLSPVLIFPFGTFFVEGIATSGVKGKKQPKGRIIPMAKNIFADSCRPQRLDTIGAYCSTSVVRRISIVWRGGA